jgi:hypothetical protein
MPSAPIALAILPTLKSLLFTGDSVLRVNGMHRLT